jgi:hypothetical protein
MKELVIDAGVILKWYLPDEEFASKALSYFAQACEWRNSSLCTYHSAL